MAWKTNNISNVVHTFLLNGIFSSVSLCVRNVASNTSDGFLLWETTWALVGGAVSLYVIFVLLYSDTYSITVCDEEYSGLRCLLQITLRGNPRVGLITTSDIPSTAKYKIQHLSIKCLHVAVAVLFYFIQRNHQTSVVPINNLDMSCVIEQSWTYYKTKKV